MDVGFWGKVAKYGNQRDDAPKLASLIKNIASLGHSGKPAAFTISPASEQPHSCSTASQNDISWAYH